VGSVFVTLTGVLMFELVRRQFLQQWGQVQEDIEAEIRRRENH
jgi:branched-chain amino acid transport system permease protein